MSNSSSTIDLSTAPASAQNQVKPVDQFKSLNFHAYAITCVVVNIVFTLCIAFTPLGQSEGNAMIGNSIWLMLIAFIVQLPLWLTGITLVVLSIAQKGAWVTGTVGSLLCPLLVLYFYFV